MLVCRFAIVFACGGTLLVADDDCEDDEPEDDPPDDDDELEPDVDDPDVEEPDDEVEVDVGSVLAWFAGFEGDPPQPVNIAAVKITKQVFTRILQQ